MVKLWLLHLLWSRWSCHQRTAQVTRVVPYISINVGSVNMCVSVCLPHLSVLDIKVFAWKIFKCEILKVEDIVLKVENIVVKVEDIVLKVEDIFKHSMVQLVYKQRNNRLPDVFDGYFKTRNEIHNLQTRNAHKLNLIRVKNNYGKSTQKCIMNCPMI